MALLWHHVWLTMTELEQPDIFRESGREGVGRERVWGRECEERKRVGERVWGEKRVEERVWGEKKGGREGVGRDN